ncbi:hypothetical protein [Anaerovorax odorimutans]|uniref:hypothetical protein n=1 Tax=Anaerovorax odorimutans TaxID=109327 RepID=UPI00041D211C|nr:hypothetical protein [Anaerovorax odorimutans]
MGILENIATFAGYISGIFGCILIFIKPFRKWFLEFIRHKIKETEQEKMILEIHNSLVEHIKQDEKTRKELKIINELQNQALLGILRNNITKVYYKYLESDSIPIYERENLIKQHNIYSNIGGNSYIDTICKEMLKKAAKQ